MSKKQAQAFVVKTRNKWMP